jgi:ribose transport system substrate-binding protein
MVSGINDELKHCPDCKAQFQSFAITDRTRITPSVQAALLADPSINYIILIYDSMAQFVVPAVTITNSQDRVKIAAFNGTPFAIGMVQDGQLEMDIGENLDWIAHAVLDSEMRLVCGLPPVADPKIPFYMFTSANAKDAGVPPRLSQGYGNAYEQGYKDLWRLN